MSSRKGYFKPTLTRCPCGSNPHMGRNRRLPDCNYYAIKTVCKTCGISVVTHSSSTPYLRPPHYTDDGEARAAFTVRMMKKAESEWNNHPAISRVAKLVEVVKAQEGQDSE